MSLADSCFSCLDQNTSRLFLSRPIVLVPTRSDDWLDTIAALVKPTAAFYSLPSLPY
jgi:hypothetical protein